MRELSRAREGRARRARRRHPGRGERRLGAARARSRTSRCSTSTPRAATDDESAALAQRYRALLDEVLQIGRMTATVRTGAGDAAYPQPPVDPCRCPHIIGPLRAADASDTPAAAPEPARESRARQAIRSHMDDTFPDLGSLSDAELKEPDRRTHRGGAEGLLPAADPARQDRHPARRAGQPPAQEARGGRVRDQRRRRPAADRHPRRQGAGRRRPIGKGRPQ